MTYAPDCLEEVRQAAHELTGAALGDIGIIGGPDHDDGYHLGLDTLLQFAGWRDWSAQLDRDKKALRGPTKNAACAVDLPTKGMRDHAKWFAALVAACKSGHPATAGIRAIIGSFDGKKAFRLDRLNNWRPVAANISHTWHAHIEWFRDIIAASPDLTGVITFYYGGEMVDGKWALPADVKIPGLPAGFEKSEDWWIGAIYAHTLGAEAAVIKGNAADAVRDAALMTVVQSLADKIEAGGGNVDTAAIIAGVRAEIDRVLPEVDSKVDDELRRMSEAFAAAAADG